MKTLYTVISRLGKKSNKYQVITVFVPIPAAHTQCKKICSTFKRKEKKNNLPQEHAYSATKWGVLLSIDHILTSIAH